VRDGHPWVFADTLRGRSLAEAVGQAVDLLDPDGQFVARALAEPEGNPVLRVFSAEPGATVNAAYLAGRIESCLRLRRSTLDEPSPGCFRLVNGDSEGIPAVTVDRFGAYLVVCLYSPVARVFERTLVDTLVRMVGPDGVYLQRRYAPPRPNEPRPGAELAAGAPAPPELEVVEGRCRFVVDVTAPGSPGLFLDMREGRNAVARLAGGREVLNCFSYTGAFSVVAAVHGASSVVSVDASTRAHGRARRNFSHNGLDLSLSGARYEFVTGDAFATLARLADKGRRFDLVVLDPPTFSSAKGRTFTALKDYADLVRAAVGALRGGGLLCACCNAVKLPEPDFDRAIGHGAALASRRAVITHRLGLPPDFPVLPSFPEGRYLKIALARVE
jgi:23S rRNA (cytosine1962-C5)-methyltransferase